MPALVATRCTAQRHAARSSHGLKCSRRPFSGSRAHVATRAVHDVTGALINPVYRSVPQRSDDDAARDKVQLLFVGESNVCRSILAEAFMRDALRTCGLQDLVACQSKASRDYQLGDAPHKSALEIIRRLQLPLEPATAARLFVPERDIVEFDLILVMDKYTAADVLREVTGYDLIDKSASFSTKVRLLGQFHPELAGSTLPDAQDIDDPLYGNLGGWQEQEAVAAAAHTVEAATLGLAQYLQQVRQQAADDSGMAFVQRLQSTVKSMDKIDWLVPPMLQGRTAPPVPFI